MGHLSFHRVCSLSIPCLLRVLLTVHFLDIDTSGLDGISHTRKRSVGIKARVGNASKFMDGAAGGESSSSDTESDEGTPPPIGS